VWCEQSEGLTAMSPGGNAGRDYVRQMRDAGYSDDEIREAMLAAGWAERDADVLLGREAAPPPPPPPADAPPRGKGTSWTPVAIACAVIVAFMLLSGPILAAILFPVFGRAREKARQSSCMSNVKQLCLGQLMYMTDYGEVMVDAREWPQDVMPYMKNAQVFVCPSDEHASRQRSGGLELSYTMNAMVSGRGLVSIRAPAQIGTEIMSRSDSMVEFRHNEGANVGFVDGHVRWMHERSWSSVELQP